MTQYSQTVGKRTEWGKRKRPQTGLLPALPALGTVLSGAGTAVGAVSILPKAKKFLGLAKTGAKAGGSKAVSGGSKLKGFLGGGTGAAIAKAGTGAYLFNEFDKLMSAGPKIGGVNILPIAALGGIGLIGGNHVMSGNFNPTLMIPLAGAGILIGVTQF